MVEIAKHYCTFSEAIREGSKANPLQAFYKTLDLETGGCCVMGAGVEAVLGRPLEPDDVHGESWREIAQAIRPLYSYLSTISASPCECVEIQGAQLSAGRRCTKPTLLNIIVHLNNHHRWTREAIADWLEAEEEKLGFVTLAESDDERNVPSFPPSPRISTTTSRS